MRVVKTLPPLTEPSTGVNFKSRASFIHHGFKSLNKNVMYKSEATSAGYKKNCVCLCIVVLVVLA